MSGQPKGFAMIAHWVDRVVLHIEEKMIAFSVILMALILIASVVLRIFDVSMLFTEEFSQFLIIFVTFLGTSYAARNGMHITMSMLSDVLKGRAKKALCIIVSLITAAALLYLAYLSLRYVVKISAFNRVSPILQIPIHYVWIIMPIGMFLTGLQYLLALIKNIAAPGAWLSYSVPAERERRETGPAESSPAGSSTFCGKQPEGEY